MTRKCLNVAIYDYDAKSKNILKPGFLRKKKFHRFYLQSFRSKIAKTILAYTMVTKFLYFRATKVKNKTPGIFFTSIVFFSENCHFFEIGPKYANFHHFH